MKRFACVLAAALLALGMGPVPIAALGNVSPAATGAGTAAARTADAGGATGPAAPKANGSVEITNVTATPSKPVVGQETTFAVTVRNDGPVPVVLREVEILPKERNRYVEEDPYAEGTNFGRLAPNETTTVRIRATFNRTGLTRLRANVTIETRDPQARDNDTKEFTRIIDPVEVGTLATPTVDVTEGTMVAKSASRVSVTVVNPAEEPMENVEVQLRGQFEIEDDTRTVRSIAADSERTFRFNVTADSAGGKTYRVEVTYQFLGEERDPLTAGGKVDFEAPETANIELTSFTTTTEKGKVKIKGRVANSGDAPASAVTLSIAGDGNVTGVQPNPKYFISGGVEVDKTAGFDLYAEVEPGVTRIPIRITYQSNGVTESKVVNVSYTPPAEEDEDAGGSPGGAVWAIGVIVALAVLGLMVYAYRNSTSGPDGDGEAPVSPDSGDAGDVGAMVGPDEGAGGPPQPRDPAESGRAAAGQARGGGGPYDGPQGGRGGSHEDPYAGGQAGGPQGGSQQAPGGGHGRASEAGGRAPGHPQGPGGGPAGTGPRGEGTGPLGGSAGGVDAGEGSGEIVVCDGCGETYATSEVGTIAVGDGTSATTCQHCQKRALEAAKVELGADEDHDRPDADGVDELVAAMNDRPTCDGCGFSAPPEDLESMTLPDGSTALACSGCREEALDAARQELTGGDGA